MLYYRQKKEQPPTKWLASRYSKAYLTEKYKVGLFICPALAFFSFLCYTIDR